MFPRRALFAAPLLGLAPPAAPAWRVGLVPGDASVLAETDGGTRLLLPSPRVRVTALTLGGTPCAAARFAPDVAGPTLLAVVAGGSWQRVILLEAAEGVAPDRAHFATRMEVLGDALLLWRDAAVPEPGGTVWRRQRWADRFEFADGCLLDRPVHTPQPGTWQAALAARRARVLRRLATPTCTLAPELLALAGVWPWGEPVSSPPDRGRGAAE